MFLTIRLDSHLGTGRILLSQKEKSTCSGTVHEAEKLSGGATIKALHHYQKCELLQPAFVSAAGYRYYGEAPDPEALTVRSAPAVSNGR